MNNISTVNAIPQMTSNITPRGIASASGFNTATNDAWKAFNGITDVNSDCWIVNARSGWLAYTFENPIRIAKYSLFVRPTTLSQEPKDWTFEGSNDGVNWTILDTQSDISWTIRNKEFYINNTNQYTRYRINISNNTSASAISISELQMFEDLTLNKTLILQNGEYKNYQSEENVNLIKDPTYYGEGVIFRLPINKNIKNIEVI